MFPIYKMEDFNIASILNIEIIKKFEGIGTQIEKSRSKTNETWKLLCRMVLEWRERENEDVDRDVQANLVAQQDLRACGLYKF